VKVPTLVSTPTDHKMNAFRLAAIVIVKQEFRFFNKYRIAILGVAERRSTRGAHNLLGRDAVNGVGVDAHKILAASSDDVSLISVRAEVTHHLLHGEVSELCIGSFPTRVLGGGDLRLCLVSELLDCHSGQRRGGCYFEIEFR
jgi:hypothetical protein